MAEVTGEPDVPLPPDERPEFTDDELRELQSHARAVQSALGKFLNASPRSLRRRYEDLRETIERADELLKRLRDDDDD